MKPENALKEKLKPLLRKMSKSRGWILKYGELIRRRSKRFSNQCPLTFLVDRRGTVDFRCGAEKLGLTDFQTKRVLEAADEVNKQEQIRKLLLKAAKLVKNT